MKKTNHIKSSFKVAIPPIVILAGIFLILACSSGGGGGVGGVDSPAAGNPTRSTSIAFTPDGSTIVAADFHNDALVIVNAITGALVAAVPVGDEPRFVAVSPDGTRAFVSNAGSGTVSVIDLTSNRLVGTISVGLEPRGIALNPDGSRLYVALHTSGQVAKVDTASLTVSELISLGDGTINPWAIAITDSQVANNLVFVSDFYSRLISGGNEGLNNAREGNIYAISDTAEGSSVGRTSIRAFASGFSADRSAFCPVSRGGTAGDNLQSEVFCPSTDDIKAVPQDAHPNQLYSLVIHDSKVLSANVAASPEPPVKFNLNIQANTQFVSTNSLSELTELRVNLNNQVKTETQPAVATASLNRLFLNDVVAAAATKSGVFYIVSRGGNYVIEATLGASGLSINAPNVKRGQTGNIPNGVAISPNEDLIVVNNEVDSTVSFLDPTTLARVRNDVAIGGVPAAGSQGHINRVGKLAFFTALGIPENGVNNVSIRSIVPLSNRGKASDNGWSACASCHPDGLADGITWFFPTGRKQTVQMDSTFAPGNGADGRVHNWNAVESTVEGFATLNARGVQGGTGAFSGTTYNHGFRNLNQATVAMDQWSRNAIRDIFQPQPAADVFIRGREVFAANCASCHGGPKWTKSQVLFVSNPAFASDPLQGGKPVDAGVESAGPQIIAFGPPLQDPRLQILEDVGTFNAEDPLEIRGAGSAIGTLSLGGIGFNVPSLLSINIHGPYLHDGTAQTIRQVFDRHELVDSTISGRLSGSELEDLEAFVKAIDVTTTPFP